MRLLDAIRQTPLLKYPNVQPYLHADIQFERHENPLLTLFPTQKYVLKRQLRQIMTVAGQLEAMGHDAFDLREAVAINDRFFTPPIVEDSPDQYGVLVPTINDGMHRVYQAIKLQVPITVVRIRNVNTQCPYYAFPTYWPNVSLITEQFVPGWFVKKHYRNPNDKKALFRDFNALFPGIQEAR